MRLLLSFLAVLILTAGSAHAASISIVSDQLIYDPGDTVTLTVTATANAGEASTQVFGDLLISGTGSLLGGNSVQTGLQSFGGAIPWVTGLTPCGPTICTAFNQIGGLSPLPVTNTPLVISIITYTMGGPGIVTISFDPTTFDFFGAAPPPAIQLNVPEPATGALLALGLLGLAAGRRLRA